METDEIIQEVIDILKGIRGELIDLRKNVDMLNDTVQTDELYSCKRAAQYLGKNISTISRYISEGRLKKVQRGGSYGILKSELMKVKYAK